MPQTRNADAVVPERGPAVHIPMSSPDITSREVDAVVEVVRSGHLALGGRSLDFEEEALRVTGATHAATVSSGTAALHIAVMAAGLGQGDVAITTPFSFVASANCLLYEGAEPLFVDVDPVTGNIDPALVADAADRFRVRADGSRLKAILPVHAFGQPADMDPILETARTHGLSVIEDACEAVGAHYRGRPAGSLGDAGTLAFYPNKQMTTGEGGMFLTRHPEWDALARSVRNQGRDVFDAWLVHSRLGFNYRMDEMSAALGYVQMTRLDDMLTARSTVADWYTTRLAQFTELVEPPTVVDTTTRMSWFAYVVRLPARVDRDRLMRHLAWRGVPSRPYFLPIHLQPFYRERFGFTEGAFPVAEDLGRRSLALPFSSVMREEQVDIVCRELIDALQRESL